MKKSHSLLGIFALSLVSSLIFFSKPVKAAEAADITLSASEDSAFNTTCETTFSSTTPEIDSNDTSSNSDYKAIFIRYYVDDEKHEFTVNNNSDYLEEGTGYTVSYDFDEETGSHITTVNSEGFEVTLTYSPDDEKRCHPEIKVTYNGTVLNEGPEYNVTEFHYDNPGISWTIIGIDNYLDYMNS